MKCRVCRGPAVIDLPRHNANFCAEHLSSCAATRWPRPSPTTTCSRRGSGCWWRCRAARTAWRCGTSCWTSATRPTGCTSGSASASYSDASAEYAAGVRRGPRPRAARASTSGEDHGYDVPTAAAATRRVPCSACGLSKRHLFDAAARDGGYDVVATGHNLDDEAAVLFGNTLRWDLEYLARQLPVLPARDGFPRKVKPLVRLTERETAAYCIVRGIDYQVEECPMAAGQPPPRLQGGAEHRRGALAGHEGRVLPRLPRPHGAAPGRAVLAGPGRRRAAAAVLTLRRPDDRARCARSAAWSSGRRPTSRSRSSSSPKRRRR